MGFLSSLFGVGGEKRPETTTSTVQTKIPTELSPFVKEVLGEAQALYKADIERGYDPYTGQMIAPLTAEEQRAMEGISGLVGTIRPYIEEAEGVYRTGAEKFTPETAQEYMSPYQRAVTDIEKREAGRQFDVAQQARDAAAVGAGGESFMGSRAAILEAEAQRNQQQLLADIEAKGLQKAYQDSQRLFSDQKARERQMAGDLARTGSGLFQAGLTEAGAEQRVGEQKRELVQASLDEAYKKFLEERDFPKQTLAEYQGSIYGNPLLRTPSRTTTTQNQPFQPSMGQNLLGLGLTGLNIFGAGGGFGSGGFSGQTLGRSFGFPMGKAKTGGGIASLPVVRKQLGSIVDETLGLEQDVAEMERENLEDQVRRLQAKQSSSGMDSFANKLAMLRKVVGYKPRDPEALSKIERDKREAIDKAIKSNREVTMADLTARRKKAEDRPNNMARFLAIQKAIESGIMGPEGINLVKGARVLGEGMSDIEAKRNALMDKLDTEEAAIKAGLRTSEHTALIDRIKGDADLQARLLNLPSEELNAMLSGVTAVAGIEKISSDISKNKAELASKRLSNAFKLSKEVQGMVKAVLDNSEQIGDNPEIFKQGVKEMIDGLPASLRGKIGDRLLQAIIKEAEIIHGGEDNTLPSTKRKNPTQKVPSVKQRSSAEDTLDRLTK